MIPLAQVGRGAWGVGGRGCFVVVVVVVVLAGGGGVLGGGGEGGRLSAFFPQGLFVSSETSC